MRCTPKAKNKISEVFSIVLLITGVVMFYFANQSYIKGTAIVQLMGVFCLGFAAYFMIKKATSFIYIIMPVASTENAEAITVPHPLKPNELAFVVAKKRGMNSEVHQCQLDLSTLVDVVPYPRGAKERKEATARFGKLEMYNYSVTVMGNEKYLLVFSKAGYSKVGAIVEPDDGMISYLKQVCIINKNTPRDEYEDEY